MRTGYAHIDFLENLIPFPIVIRRLGLKRMEKMKVETQAAERAK